MTAVQYTDLVHKELESFGYPEMISEFNVEDVAYAMARSIQLFYQNGFSHRLCAITIWRATLVHQVMPLANEMVKH
jgi:hypothetical protein